MKGKVAETLQAGGLRKWVPLVISVVLTPVFLFAGFISAGGGEGTYFWAKILFPYTMLSTIFFGSIGTPFLFLAAFQFLIYGLFVSLIDKRNLAFSLLLGIHMGFTVICFIFVGANFS